MKRCLIAALLLVVALASAAAAQTPGKRVALVIGNGAYAQETISLPNPPNDARDLAGKLDALGFEVIEAIDRDFNGMQASLLDFAAALDGAEAGLLFYAGHGMEYAGKNYLLPTDARLDRESDVRLRLIDVDDVIWTMEQAVPTRVIILDACRDNPLALQLQSNLPADRVGNVGRGLAPVNTDVGTFIAFSTAPGETAADGSGRNSPFAAAMLANLERPGLDADALMREVRNDVIEATDERQVPWNSSSLREPFVVHAADGSSPVADPQADPRAEQLVWDSIIGSDDPDNYIAYLERFGDFAPNASIARAILATLPGGGVTATRIGPYETDRIAMAEPIRLGCSISAQRQSFGTTGMPLPVAIETRSAGGLQIAAAELPDDANLRRLLALRDGAIDGVVLQADGLRCQSKDRLTTDGRGGQWRSWSYLVRRGANLVDRQYDNWRGRYGDFRIESDIVVLGGGERPACRAFTATNSIFRRAFAGYACADQTPELAALFPAFETLAWED